MLSHGQTVHFRPHSVIHHQKAMHHTIKMSYLEPILVHPVRRQIFCDTSGMIFFTILKLRLIPLLILILNDRVQFGEAGVRRWHNVPPLLARTNFGHHIKYYKYYISNITNITYEISQCILLLEQHLLNKLWSNIVSPHTTQNSRKKVVF